MQAAPKIFEVHLTEKEMQMIVYAVTGFYRRITAEKRQISPEQTAIVLNAFKKFKAVVDNTIHVPPLVGPDGAEIDSQNSNTP